MNADQRLWQARSEHRPELRTIEAHDERHANGAVANVGPLAQRMH
jgi:hypothetical protein